MTTTQVPIETLPALITDPVESAKAAGLRYVSDMKPGITRKRAGKGFAYRAPDGTRITDADEIERIKSLGIPPAWTDVWICPNPRGHIQATGRDEKGRKQYRYHTRWREVRDETKYGRMVAFGHALPTVRRRVEQDLSLAGLPRDRVLATVVKLLETTLIRVGNKEYARANKSFGLTTMRNRHVNVEGAYVRFKFRGKSGKSHTVGIKDRRLAAVVRRCQDLPGQELFEYTDDEKKICSISSNDVNDYLREVTGQDLTAKDFRTWHGTVITARELRQTGPCETKIQSRRNIVAAIKATAEVLGNTPAICRKSYVHPSVLEAYDEGTLIADLDGCEKEVSGNHPEELTGDEAIVLCFLEKQLREAAA